MFKRFGSRLLEASDNLLVAQMDVGELIYGKKVLTAELNRDLADIATSLEEISTELLLDRTLVTAKRLRVDLPEADLDRIKERLSQLSEDLKHDLARTWFKSVPPGRAHFYGKSFGQVVDASFPAAKDEAVEAHNAFALGLYTSSVFHMMRCVEFGMRQLAIAVGVTASKVPLEFQQWQNIIDQIQSRYDASGIGQWPEPARGHARAFFERTLSDLYAFKDETRNILMHSRSGLYDEPHAMSIRNRVAEFFDRLAKKTQQGNSNSLLNVSEFES